MRLICWNCRGLGTPRAVCSLGDVLSSHSLQVVGLVETKLKNQKWTRLRCRLGFKNCFSVDCNGRSGGLALLWKDNVCLEIINYSCFHIHCEIKSAPPFRLSVFYGHPRRDMRCYSWDLLKRVNSVGDMPWVVLGDFNEILNSYESTSFDPGRMRSIQNFRSTIMDLDLHDIGYHGYPYTYSNRRKGRLETRVRLDRVLANSQWISEFPSVSVHHLMAYTSDHCPIMLNLMETMERRGNQFKYEAMWTRHHGYNKLVCDNWNIGDRPLSQKLAELSSCLQKWNRTIFGNVQGKIWKLKKELVTVSQAIRTGESIEKEQQLRQELDEWKIREEVLWKQRSRAVWLNEGDRNTKFFHARASCRRKTNLIKSLMNATGELVSSTQGKLDIAVDYFKDLYTTSRSTSRVPWDILLGEVPRRVTREQNLALCRPYTEEEIRVALFQLHPDKAPGLDGFSNLFFQKHWDLVKLDLLSEVFGFLNQGVLDHSHNETLLVLIPKVETVHNMKDIRPISLTSVISKIISKVLVNRLQPLLETIISPFQSAFIKGRMISDNFLIAQELSHYIRTRSTQKTGYASLKLDMSKAYDRMEWDFLEQMLSRLGFDSLWIERVMLLVRSVKYRVKLNNSISTSFYPGRGLRQGDPISPYLFIICTEWLSLSLNHAANASYIQGIQVNRNAPSFSHLLFADDSLLFLRMEKNTGLYVKTILSAYELASGQQVNMSKSEICFSKTCTDQMRTDFLGQYPVSVVASHGCYLGYPLSVSRLSCDIFKDLTDKMWRKVSAWYNSVLSFGGKEVLVKSILTAIPQYIMSCYYLLDGCIKAMRAAISKFWWNSRKDKRGIHWISMSNLCKDKMEGGLGFKELRAFNIALLSKQVWRMLTKPNLLVSKLFKARYFQSGSILDAQLGSRPSPVWRSVFKGLNVIRQGVDAQTHSLGMRWNESSNGVFSVKPAYHLARRLMVEQDDPVEGPSNVGNLRIFWKKLWRINIPAKIKIFFWRLYHDAIPTMENLKRRKCTQKGGCAICGFQSEDSIHAILECWWAKSVWQCLGVWSQVFDAKYKVIADWMYVCSMQVEQRQFILVMVAAWYIWYMRNKVHHGKSLSDPRTTSSRIIQLVADFSKRDLIFRVVNFCPELTWCPPEQGWIKINTDGAWNGNSKTGAVGIIARDSEGRVCFVKAAYYCEAYSSYQMEGLAMCMAMRVASNQMMRNVIFESDCMELVEAIQCGKTKDKRDDGWFHKCLQLLSKNDSWTLQGIFRESNVGADAIAKISLARGWEWHTIDSCPAWISDIVHCHS